MIYDKTFKLYRVSATRGARNRPVMAETLVGTYPCRLSLPSAKKLTHAQQDPQAVANLDYVLYTGVLVDIQSGDIVEVDSVKYIASTPYKPGGHHTEVGIYFDKEV